MKNKHKTDANDNKNKYSKSDLNFKCHDKHKSIEKNSLMWSTNIIKVVFYFKRYIWAIYLQFPSY